MTLEEDIAAWVADRPDWQKDIVSRFCRNETVSSEDIATIADQLIAGSFPSVAAISAADVPGSSATGEPVRLTTISAVTGVNALLPNQRLSFGGNGLTVIYGDNASGKSGYARLIRQAVTARVKADLLGDVFSSQREAQAALFDYTVGNAAHAWRLDGAASQALSSVRFYDEECGDAYVTLASEISYRPSALTLLDRLSNACDALQQELNSRLAANQQGRPDLPLLQDGTEAASFLHGITHNTTSAQIDEVTTLTKEHGQHLAHNLAEEARLKGSDPSKEKARLTQLAAYWTTVHGYVDRLASALSAEAFDALQLQRNSATELREAAKIASAKNFNAEPLQAVGSLAWRALWEAAREYSESEAYHDHPFPATTEGSVCVLCQQPLDVAGRDRLTRFQEFMTDTTARDASTAEKALEDRRDALAQLQTHPASVTAALSHLQSGGERVEAVETWLSQATTIATALVSWIDGTARALPAPVAASPSALIGRRAQDLRDSGTAINDSTFTESLRLVTAKVRELQGKSALASSKEHLTAEVERLKARAAIEAAKRLADTTGITRKSTELTTVHVTSLVRDQFTRETERLHLRRVTLDHTGGRKNSTLEHKPKLLGATVNSRIDAVLSEGEQTALGLAGFLTEVEFDESKSAVVLDDPVSSLDAGRRSRVAKRLVELAQDRQVVVFTHEATFVTALNKTARDAGVTVTRRAIIRQGDRPGKATDDHPWSVKDTKARIGELGAELARLRKDRDQLDSDQYCERAQTWGGRLSQAWERAVNLDVVNELVDRGTNEVRPKMFKLLVGITVNDDNDFQCGYAKASEWAPRHDQAPEINFVPPEPDEMESELIRFSKWFDRIKTYKK